MNDLHAEMTVEVREVPRSFPAILGALLAMAGIIFAESLVSWWTGSNSQPSPLLELPLLVLGGAGTGHLAQYATQGSQLRLGRILVAVVTFDVAFASVCHMLTR